MAFRREIGQVLRTSVALDATGQDRLLSRGAATSDLTGIMRAAAYHGVAGYVHDAFSGTGLLPEGEAASIGRFRELTVRAHLCTMQDLAFVRRALDPSGIPWLVVKGPTLAGPVHGAVELRSYGDLDVLVDPRRLGETIEALQAGGAQLLDQNWTLLRDVMKGEVHLSLPMGTALDLHWHLLNDQAVRRRFHIDLPGLFERRHSVQVGTVPVPTLSHVDTFVYVAMHAVLSGADRLVWMKDLERLVTRGELDVRDVRLRARQWGAELAVGAAMSRAVAAIDGFAPEDLLAPSSRGGRTWLVVAERVWQRYPVEREDGDGSVARMLARSVRTRAIISVSVWARKLAVNVQERLRPRTTRKRLDPDDPGSGRFPSGGLAARQAFLDAVAAEGNSWPLSLGSTGMEDGGDERRSVESSSAPAGEPGGMGFRLRAEQVSWQKIDDGIVVFDLRTSEQFKLNAAAAALFDALAEGASRPGLVELLIVGFGADDEVARRDADEFMQMLRERDFLEPAG